MKTYQSQLLAVLALPYFAMALPHQSRAAGSSNIWVQGQPFEPSVKISAASSSSAYPDVMATAQGFVSKWTTPSDASTEQTGYIYSNDGNSRLYLDYTMNMGACQPILPQITWQGSMMQCGASSCSHAVAQSITTTDTRTVGFSTLTSISGTVGFDIPAIAKAEVTVATSTGNSINTATTTSNTTTQTYTYNLQPYDTCLPVTIDFQTSCTSKVDIGEFIWQYQKVPGSGEWWMVVDNVGNLCTEWDLNSQYWSTSAPDYTTLNQLWKQNFGPNVNDFIQNLCSQTSSTPGQGLYASVNQQQFTMVGCTNNQNQSH